MDELDTKYCKGLVSIMFVRWRSQWAAVHEVQAEERHRTDFETGRSTRLKDGT